MVKLWKLPHYLCYHKPAKGEGILTHFSMGGVSKSMRKAIAAVSSGIYNLSPLGWNNGTKRNTQASAFSRVPQSSSLREEKIKS